MPATEPIVITTDSTYAELAPAVLTVLEEAGDTGLESRSKFPNSISHAVRQRFQVAPSAPERRGARIDSVLPDFNIELVVSVVLVRIECILKDGHMRFITAEGRNLLKMPLADIHSLVKAVYDAVRANNRAINRAKRRNSGLELENQLTAILEDELTAIKNQLAPEDPENPTDHDARVRRFREIDIRIGASPFRSALMEVYQGQCAITESRVTQVLQAAHIKPYRGAPTNRVDNGLLLRVDLHQLFDKDLIGIHPDSREICISKELIGTEYENLDGRPLAERARQIPSRQGLKIRWKCFLKTEEKRIAESS